MEKHIFKVLADESCQPGTSVEKDGVHFGCYAPEGVRPALLLYRRGTEEIEEELLFPEEGASCGFYHMKVKLRAALYEYNFRMGNQVVTDPYARKLAGRRVFGAQPAQSEHGLRGGLVTKTFDWEGDRRPQLSYEEAIMYHLHVRGFTKQKHSGVRRKGTFAGVCEKLPYLKELGVNQLKLMPVYEFPELVRRGGSDGVPESRRALVAAAGQEMQDAYRMNYWGYGPGFYFAPKASYAASADTDLEFKTLVKEAHRQGIEVLLEFHFTEETDVLLIGECLTYWAEEFHVDGFSVICRPEVSAELARLPLFCHLKLICEWLPEKVVQENGKTRHRKLAESNDGFMNDCRRFLKGDEDTLRVFTERQRRNPAGCTVVNYITNHDGFTLADLVSYDRKHNLENGEHDRDGSDYNCSWNCGVEGPTKRKEIVQLRMRQRKNALAMLLLAQGTPMLLAGDEFGNSQDGNNNPYCHDSERTWLTWNHAKSSKELTQFVKDAIAYRKDHALLHQGRELHCMESRADGFPDLSYHGERAWYCDFSRVTRHIGCMYTGRGEQKTFLYLAYNMYWTEQEFALPLLPKQMSWFRVMDTSLEQSFLPEAETVGRVRSFCVPPRTIMILEGREDETVGNEQSAHLEKGKRTL